MKFFDTKLENAYFHHEILEATKRVAESGVYLLGEETSKLEEEFSDKMNIKHSACVKNATDAITMIVKYLWKPGMSVILPNFGAYPTAVAVQAAGVPKYYIRYVDVDSSMTIDPTKLPRDIQDGIIIPVHLFGNIAAMPMIMNYAKEHNLWVIEDCAQATGATDVGRRAHFSVFSFYPTKPLASMGDGGMICSNSLVLDEFRKLRFYGQNERKTVELFGGVNSRIDEWQAAVVRSKLERFMLLNQRKRLIAERYLKIVKGISWRPGAVFHQFPVLVAERDTIVRPLFEQEGIPTMIHYPEHISETPGCEYNGLLRPKDQVGYRVNDRILSIPCHAFMTETEIEKVENVLKEIRAMEL